MIIINRIEQYNNDCVYFHESIKNNILQDGYFIRIIYSTDLFSLNGIYINIDLHFTHIEKYYNKFLCFFDTTINKPYIGLIKNIEHNILEKVNIKNKIPQYNLYEQIKTGELKIYNNNNNNIDKQHNNFILKITGIWETSNQYGVTYKFYNV